MNFTAQQWQIIGACFAYFNRRRQQLKPNTRIAYYTTAETALRIIEDQTFWLRNPELMNDYQEVIHGRSCLETVLADPQVVAAAAGSVDQLFPGFFADLVSTWAQSAHSPANLRFVASLSEIDIGDNRGELSMWRAYGGINGVALVMRDALMDLDSNFVNTFHSPVLYGDAGDVKALVLEIFANLAAIGGVVAANGSAFLKDRLLIALEFAMLSIKHVGFKEEREWRMIHHYRDESAHHKYRSRVVRGNAEVVCEINLASHADLVPGTMIEKVLVGPCAFPKSTEMAIRRAFHGLGGNLPLVVASDIPLRHF